MNIKIIFVFDISRKKGATVANFTFYLSKVEAINHFSRVLLQALRYKH